MQHRLEFGLDLKSLEMTTILSLKGFVFELKNILLVNKFLKLWD